MANRYLTTLAAAEQLYDALYQWNKIGSIEVTDLSLAFFRDHSPSVGVGTYASTKPTFIALTSSIKEYADGFFSIVHKYTPTNGSLAEQFSRTDGTPLSAGDLTWSYSAFLTAASRRNGKVPASWDSNPNSPSAPPPPPQPSSCTPSSAQGTYITPPITAPTAPASSCPEVANLTITFNVAKPTTFGQTVLITGNVSALGTWDLSKAVEMSADAYKAGYPRWYGFASLPKGDGEGVEYKYYLKEPRGGGGVFEAGANRVLTLSKEGCERVRTVVDIWHNG